VHVAACSWFEWPATTCPVLRPVGLSFTIKGVFGNKVFLKF
jgi:hypothetical protein